MSDDLALAGSLIMLRYSGGNCATLNGKDQREPEAVCHIARFHARYHSRALICEGLVMRRLAIAGIGLVSIAGLTAAANAADLPART
jgi:hypothetical protein